MIMTAVFLFILGLCSGSFVNAVVWRVHKQAKSLLRSSSKSLPQGQKPKARKTILNFAYSAEVALANRLRHSGPSYDGRAKAGQFSILTGRSQCVHCGHKLAGKDLAPLLSWLFLRGRCRYCKKAISWQYPVVELALAVVFVVSYVFWPASLGDGGQKVLLSSWLIASVGLLALLVYDFRWMLLPNRILYPTFFVALAGRLAYIIWFSPDKIRSLLFLALSLAIASGIFFAIFLLSSGRWIGFGDVRLGLISGVLLADPLQALLMIFIASILGTIFVLPDLLSGRQKITGKLPLGPFLIIATLIAILAGDSIIGWYKNLLY